MLKAEDNEILTRVGPGTPMGELLRRYWTPACLTAEIPEPGGAPARVRLLGENLVAFRDTSGQVGLIEEECPHRGASLFLIVGWDVAAELTSWERWEEIQRLATLVVVNRPGAGRPAGLDGDGWRVEEVTVPNLEISSTDLRERAATGRPLDYLVPEAAVHCLRARGLYATDR